MAEWALEKTQLSRCPSRKCGCRPRTQAFQHVELRVSTLVIEVNFDSLYFIGTHVLSRRVNCPRRLLQDDSMPASWTLGGCFAMTQNKGCKGCYYCSVEAVEKGGRTDGFQSHEIFKLGFCFRHHLLGKLFLRLSCQATTLSVLAPSSSLQEISSVQLHVVQHPLSYFFPSDLL